MCAPTPRQLSVIAFADRGLSDKQIAAKLSIPPTVVRQELEQVARMVVRGHYVPSPLPIEQVAKSQSARER